MVGRRAAGVALGPQEVGQQVGIAPALAAVVVPPGVVVQPVAADVDHRVDRRRAAEDLAARPVHRAAAGPVLLGRLVIPVEGGLEEQVDGRRDVDLVRGVRRPGLEQQDPGVGFSRQPRGQHAAGAAGADDDVVVHGHTFPGLGPRADEYPIQPRAQLGWRCSRKPGPRVSAYPVNYGQLSRFRDVRGDFRRLVARRPVGHSTYDNRADIKVRSRPVRPGAHLPPPNRPPPPPVLRRAPENRRKLVATAEPPGERLLRGLYRPRI